MPYVRTVKTASGATAVQIVYSWRRGSREIEHVGSAHDDVELELLKAAARQRLAAGQGELDLGLDTGAAGGPLAITASRMGCLADALEHAYRVLGFDQASGGDGVFTQLVLARIIEPVSKLDSLRVLEEAGLAGRPGPGGAPLPAPGRAGAGGAGGDLGDQCRAAGPQRAAVAGGRRRAGRARAGRGGGGAGEHDHVGAGRRQ